MSATRKCVCGGCGSLDYIKTITRFYQSYHWIAIAHAACREDAVPILTYLIEVRGLQISYFRFFRTTRHKKTTKEAKVYLKTNAHVVIKTDKGN